MAPDCPMKRPTLELALALGLFINDLTFLSRGACGAVVYLHFVELQPTIEYGDCS